MEVKVVTTTYYPRRFLSYRLLSPNAVEHSFGDTEVDTLFEHLTDRSQFSLNWEFRERVLSCALRLFGHFPDWLQANQNSGLLTHYGRRFITDMTNYIRTGQRELRPIHWLSLLEERDSEELGSPAKPKETKISMNTVTLLRMWCSHPNGVEDLCATLYVLFGKSFRDKSL